MLNVTDSALEQFKKIISASESDGDWGIRIFRSGGCCGPSYGIDITAKGVEGDDLLQKDGLKIFIDPAASEVLDNATIDYSDTNKGFTILGLKQSGCCC